MMSAPAPYPTVGANVPAPDDAQIEKKMPSICVDYLSHNWAQEDVWQSWKAMTKRKNEVSIERRGVGTIVFGPCHFAVIALLTNNCFIIPCYLSTDCKRRPARECQLEDLG